MKRSIIGVYLLVCMFVNVFFANETAYSTENIYQTQGDVWDGTTMQPTQLVHRNGVYFYQITKCSELAYIAMNGGNWLEYNYMLGNNLIFNKVKITADEMGNCTNKETLRWLKPINGFNAIFDGNGFLISGLYINEPNKDDYNDSGVGLFGTVKNNARIRNLIIQNSYVGGNVNVGGIVGIGEYDSVCYNCGFSGVVRAKESKAGGIVGNAYSMSVYKCANHGNIYSPTYSGGIAGTADYWNSISKCINYGRVSTGETFDGQYTGGITGNGSPSKCRNYGTVIGIKDVGGISGSGYGRKNANFGIVTGKNNVGGISGVSTGNMSENRNSGKVAGINNVGGICGNFNYDIENVGIKDVYNTGEVTGHNYVGSIVGNGTECVIENAYNIGNVICSGKAGAILSSDDYIWGRSSTKNVFFATDVNTVGNVCGGFEGVVYGAEGKTTEELRRESTYPHFVNYESGGWHFKDDKNYYGDPVWCTSPYVHDGCPYLWWEDDELRELVLTVGEATSTVYGKMETTDAAPIIKNDRTMLPARFVAENLGAKVSWNERTKEVIITKDKTVIRLTIGSDKARVNGGEYELDSPAFIENNRTYTPVRFIAERLGASVEWNSGAQEVTITKK